MQIETYSGKYDDEIIALIFGIQNNESKIGLSIEEQPDLLDIRHNYKVYVERVRKILGSEAVNDKNAE